MTRFLKFKFYFGYLHFNESHFLEKTINDTNHLKLEDILINVKFHI